MDNTTCNAATTFIGFWWEWKHFYITIPTVQYTIMTVQVEQTLLDVFTLYRPGTKFVNDVMMNYFLFHGTAFLSSIIKKNILPLLFKPLPLWLVHSLSQGTSSGGGVWLWESPCMNLHPKYCLWTCLVC